MSKLAKMDSFYVIVGSAAGTLIGLQFVVITLVAQRPALRAQPRPVPHLPRRLSFTSVPRCPCQRF
jgi:hypothetical protein